VRRCMFTSTAMGFGIWSLQGLGTVHNTASRYATSKKYIIDSH